MNCEVSSSIPSPDLPWIACRVEKYRPKTLDELISHEDIIKIICKFIDEDKLPHLLFYGPPGTGKTSTILACARRLYPKEKLSSMVYSLSLRSPDSTADVAKTAVYHFQRKVKSMNFDKIAYASYSIPVTEDGMQAIVALSQGDMRRALNVLQSTSLAHSQVTESAVYTCTGHPLKEDLQNMIHWMLNEDFVNAYKNIIELKQLKGLALQDILTETHRFVHLNTIRIQLLIKLADIEYRLLAGSSEKIQLSALIAAFQSVRLETSEHVT